MIWKSALIAFLLAVATMPAFVSAQSAAASTNPDTIQALQALIAQLQAQIKSLQTQVETLRAQVVSSAKEIENVKQEIAFTRTLQRGATGNEVKKLQEFLKQFPDIYPQGLITGYYGALTESAVKKWQEKQGIESVGIVGPRTLAKLNELVLSGAGQSGIAPPGLLTAPGIQDKFMTTGTATAIGTSSVPFTAITATTTMSLAATSTSSTTAVSPLIPSTSAPIQVQAPAFSATSTTAAATASSTSTFTSATSTATATTTSTTTTASTSNSTSGSGSTTATTIPSASVPGAQPIGYWKFDGNGNNEITGSPNVVTAGSALFKTSGGRFNGYLYLPGGSDYGKIPYSSMFDLQNFTIEFWFRQRSNQSFTQNLLYKGTPANNYNFYVFRNLWNQYNNGPVIAGSTAANSGYWHQASNPNEPPHNSWHHVVYTRNSSIQAYYIDGVLIHSRNYPTSGPGSEYTGPVRTPAVDIIIGNPAPDTDIDNLRIYNYALGYGEVRYNWLENISQSIASTASASGGGGSGTTATSTTATTTAASGSSSGWTAGTGVCLVRDGSTSVPAAAAPNVGQGYAKLNKPGVSTISGLQSACASSDFSALLNSYCQSNSNPVQQQVMTYDQNGSFSSLSCGAFGCNSVYCPTSSTSTSASTSTATSTALSGAGTCTGFALSFANGKTSYVVGENVTYTYACSSGAFSTVAVRVIEPNGTATTINQFSGSMSTNTLGFTTSNFASGTYTLKACFDSSCSTVAASQTFTVVSSSTAVTSTVVSDTTPPVISNVYVDAITANSAYLHWATNEASGSNVEYSTNQLFFAGVEGTSGAGTGLYALVTQHDIQLSGLQAGTTYYYRVSSKDASGNIATSSVSNFTTASPAQLPDLVVSAVEVPSSAAPGQSVTLRAWVINQGLGTSSSTKLLAVFTKAGGNFNAPYQPFEETQALLDVPPLAPRTSTGNSVWVSWSATIPQTTDSVVFFSARANSTNGTVESSYSNNDNSERISIVQSPTSLQNEMTLSQMANVLQTLQTTLNALLKTLK